MNKQIPSNYLLVVATKEVRQHYTKLYAYYDLVSKRFGKFEFDGKYFHNELKKAVREYVEKQYGTR